MWQSAHDTPLRAWTPWLHISNSGCCALYTGAFVSPWTQAWNGVPSGHLWFS